MTAQVTPIKFVLLIILDGWGIAPRGPGNAISQANTVNINRLWASFPHTQLQASGEAVGLPRGEAGNTETGHLNLGAGAIVYQDLARINMAIADGSFFSNPQLLDAINHARSNNSKLHLMGLMGAGGVHSNLEHLFALIQLCRRQSFQNVYLHLFSDGRDSPPTSAKTYISQVNEVIKREGIGKVASIMGRYWAMDRDLRWDRTAKAYFALTRGEGRTAKSAEEVIDLSYSEAKTDEFIEPTLISDSTGRPIATIADNDSVIFFNFRIDRPRQLSRAFVLTDFSQASADLEFDPYTIKYAKKHEVAKISKTPIFDRGKRLENLFFVIMTEYAKPLVANGAGVAFPPVSVEAPLGRVISDAQLRQLRAAESEKERFVTYYFNGQYEPPFPLEERLIVPSPKVPTYDLMPQMSAIRLTEEILSKLRAFVGYNFILVNFANPDMVAHTGNIGATTKACEIVDECVGKLVNFCLAYEGAAIITADHGNAEQMIDSQTGQAETEHSISRVPFIAVLRDFQAKPQTLQSGILADIAPTIISLLGLEKPATMTGRNLLEYI